MAGTASVPQLKSLTLGFGENRVRQKEHGVITDAEFESKKQELLKRL